MPAISNIRISVSKPNLISKINGSVTLPVNRAAVRYEKRTNDIRRIVHRLAYIQHTDWRAAAILSELSAYQNSLLFQVRLQRVKHFPNIQSLQAVAWPPSGHKMPTLHWGGSSGETMDQYLGRLKREEKRMLVYDIRRMSDKDQ